jgi:hypothetical protein
LFVVVGTAVTAGCASSGFVPETRTMPAARSALRPEYRLFYDALIDYGDWVLIEPHGFVFRPRVDFNSFRPYGDGFWAPSDPWGWVWISAEPFGWATYHYGYWFRDSFQGWVWSPGINWGPAWVTWELAGTYAGWAPLPPPGAGGRGGIPASTYLFAPIERLGSTDLSAHVVTRDRLGAAAANAQPVDNIVEHDGVRFDAGPSFALVERARGGPLPRVKIEDALGPAGGSGARGGSAADTSSTAALEAAREAATATARQARQMMERGGTIPARLPVLRPAVPTSGTGETTKPAPKPTPKAPARPPAARGASADTTG